MKTILTKKTCARIPTKDGEFKLCLYLSNVDDKEHLALVMGDVTKKSKILVRAHSECFTGDVLGSKRCDCGEQLHNAMAMIAQEGEGVVLYLRQEGRGIGLEKKLDAYNLQDQGYDTVDANILLGHHPDEREYSIAAFILKDLGIKSVRLLTNNLEKVTGLKEFGITVQKRIPITGRLNPENETYMKTKIERMSHIIKMSDLYFSASNAQGQIKSLVYLQNQLENAARFSSVQKRPFITVSYAQSIDGSIATNSKEQIRLSGHQSLVLTHRLRAAHDAILIGIETVLTDNPQLTVRLTKGKNPQPIILDSRIRMPIDSRLMKRKDLKPWLISINGDFDNAETLQKKGAKIIQCSFTKKNKIDLAELVKQLYKLNIKSLMVEGGAQVISSFVTAGLVDQFMITVTPSLVGGLQAISGDKNAAPPKIRLGQVEYQQLGEDMIIWARPTRQKNDS